MSLDCDHERERSAATGRRASRILYAGGTYVLWGFVPLYWAMLDGVSPVEITLLHRILWGAVFAASFTAIRRRGRQIAAIFRDRAKLLALVTSSILIAVNWTIFIWCVSTHQLVESSLGYYLTPLVSMAVGVLLLGEKISRLRATAIALAAVAVAVQAIELGHIPWVARRWRFPSGSTAMSASARRWIRWTD